MTKREVIVGCNKSQTRSVEVGPGMSITMLAPGLYEGRWERNGGGLWKASGDIDHVLGAIRRWTKQRE